MSESNAGSMDCYMPARVWYLPIATMLEQRIHLYVR